MSVFNLLGQEVARLEDGYQGAGAHHVSFDASGLSSGTYLYLMEAGDFKAIKRAVLLK